MTRAILGKTRRVDEMLDVLGKLTRLRRRLRFQRAVEAAALAAVAAIALGCALLLASRASRVGPWAAWGLGWALGLLPVLVGLGAAARRVTRFEAARALDAANGLGDRVGSALALGLGGAAATEPFVAALWIDAGRAAAGADVGRAAPWRLPRDLRAVALAAVAFGVTWAIGWPAPASPVKVAAPPELYLAVADADLAVAAAAADRVAAEAERLDDDELRRMAADLRKLWADVRDEKLGREEAFARLAAIEERADHATAGDFPLIREKLHSVAKALSKDGAVADLSRSLDREDFAKAREALAKLAADLAAGRMAPEEMRRLSRAMAAAAAAVASPTPEEKRADSLRKDIAALEKKPERTPEEERTLERKKKDLAALEKEMEKSAEERKMVERLERDLEDLAKMLGAGDGAGAAGGAQEVEDDLGGMESKLGRSEALAKIKKALAEGKLTVATGKSRQKGEGEEGDDGGDGDGDGGGEGDGEGVGLKMKRFMVKAGKGPGAPRPGGPGEPGDDPLAAGKKPGDELGDAPKDEGGKPGDERPGGPGAPGDAPGPKGGGAASKLEGTRHKDVDVPGKHGAGPVRSTVMMGAATKGFAVRGYRPMYDAAAAGLEDALEEDRVPLGYKHYVRRYMELIRPE